MSCCQVAALRFEPLQGLPIGLKLGDHNHLTTDWIHYILKTCVGQLLGCIPSYINWWSVNFTRSIFPRLIEWLTSTEAHHIVSDWQIPLESEVEHNDGLCPAAHTVNSCKDNHARIKSGGGPTNFWRFLKQRCFYSFYRHFYVFCCVRPPPPPPREKMLGPHLRRKNGRTSPLRKMFGSEHDNP